MNRAAPTRVHALLQLALALTAGWAAAGCAASPTGPADGLPDPPYRLPADAAWAQVWCESPMRKIFPTQQPPLRRGDAIALWAARGESEPAQIVVRPARTIAQARVRFEQLAGPGRLDVGRLSANFVGWVNVDRTRWHGDRTGPTPDPLLPNQPTDLKPGASQPIWITVTVPRDAAPGDYSGKLLIEGAGVRVPVDLRLHVFDFALPEAPSLTTLVRLWDVPRPQRPIWWENLARHRISGEAYPGPIELRRGADAITPDFAAFDGYAESYFGTYGLRVAHVPNLSLGNSGGFHDRGRRWAGLPIFSAQFDRAFTAYCRSVADHLREKGWLRWTQFQFWDEPKPGEMIADCKRLARLVRAAAPDATIYLTAAPTPELYGLVDIWCVPLVHGFPAEACAQHRQAGDAIWAYDNRLYSLDVDSSSTDIRGFSWRLFGADIVGVEWWAINKWRSDPYREPNQYPSQNGGGFFLYPPRGGERPVNSIRWEMVREGIEDHDYLAVLAEAIDAACRRLGVSDPSLSGDARAKALCATVAPDVRHATADPQALAATRMQIAQEILFHRQQPDLVFAVRTAGGRERIVGRAAPGAAISLAGKPVSVAADGTFSWTAAPSARSVVLEASAGSARKALTVPL